MRILLRSYRVTYERECNGRPQHRASNRGRLTDLELIGDLSEKITHLDRQIERVAASHKETQLLMSVPGNASGVSRLGCPVLSFLCTRINQLLYLAINSATV